MKPLLWKEFKEIRWIWLTALGSIILFVLISDKSTNNILGPMWIFLGASFGILYCGFAGARSFSGEREKGTFSYLYTRPVHPTQILWVKYIMGFLQVTSLLLTFIITIIFIHNLEDFYHEVYGIFTDPGFWIWLSFFIAYYTLCFFISILTNDTLRSFLIGFSLTLVAIGTCIYLSIHNIINVSPNELFVIKYGLYFIPAFVSIIGAIGIVYLSVLRKRLVWKTTFSLILLLGLYIYHFNMELLFGDMKPIGWTKIIHLLDQNNSAYGAGYQFHYFNNKVYAFEFLSKDSALQLVAVDVNNPRHPKEKPILKFPPYTWNPCFDNDKLYTIQNTLQPQYFHQSVVTHNSYLPNGHQTTVTNPGELVIYDLQQPDTPKMIQRIPLPSFEMDTTLNPETPLPFIRTSDHYVYLQYSINTGWEYRDTNYQLTTQKAYERSTSIIHYSRKDMPLSRYHSPLLVINKQLSYKQHILEFDKTNNTLINQFDLSSAAQFPESPFTSYYSRFSSDTYLIKRDRFSNSSVLEIFASSDTTYSHKLGSLNIDIILNSFQIKGKYLYASTREHPLEVYDLTNPQHPTLLSSSDWNWLDKRILKENTNPYPPRGLGMKGNNRLSISSERGLLFYDISNPAHPRVIGRLYSEQMGTGDIHGDYLYNYGPSYGFSIFKLPEVKS